MRKNFAQVLKDAKIDINKEYSRLYSLLYKTNVNGIVEDSLYEHINNHFSHIWFRGTALTLKEFDEDNGFSFCEQPANFNINYLVLFCEYFYNIIMGYMHANYLLCDYLQFIMSQIQKVIFSIGYTTINQDRLIIFVEKSQSAIAVSEIIEDKDLSYKTIYYNHHSMKGNIEGKKAILLKYANLLESKSKLLHNIDSSLKDDLFYLFNNLNIRHNNIGKDSKNYKRFVSEMSFEQIEEWYDETYQMCLFAFLEIEQYERRKKFARLKENIEKTK